MPLKILRVFDAVFRLQAFDVIGPPVTELTAQEIAMPLIDRLWSLTVPDLSESAQLILERQKADQDVGFRLIDEALIVFPLKVLVSIRLSSVLNEGKFDKFNNLTIYLFSYF